MRTGFVSLPDTPGCPDIRAALPLANTGVVTHASGRPWLVGNRPAEECALSSAGPVRLMVIGHCPMTVSRLHELTARIRALPDVDDIARQLTGSWHLVVSVDGDVRVQGNLTGLRRVFHSRVGDVPVAADRADVLAALTGAGVDEELLATQVACGLLPPPLGEQSRWQGVSTVPPDSYLALEHRRTRTVRWWSPPRPETPLKPGAEAVRLSLDSAITARTQDAERLGTDLSGGLDSTSLALLAARHAPDLITFRCAATNPASADRTGAAQATAELDKAAHIVFQQRELPDIFADPGAFPVDAEEPYPRYRTLARTRHVAEALAGNGVTRHLTGHGGDELFHSFPGYLHGLLRRRPFTAVRHVRGHRALNLWSAAPTWRALLNSENIGSWWRTQAEQLSATPFTTRLPHLGWGLHPVGCTAWASSEAVATARSVLHRTSRVAEPFAADRGQHQFLLALRNTSPAYRQLGRLYGAAGVALETPYLDDRVVEAVLSVRLRERASPWGYKPLLAEAMHPHLPADTCERSTKDELSQELRDGLWRQLGSILGVLADSALSERGLIDPDVLRARLQAPHRDLRTAFDLEHLLGCEAWLRAAEPPTGWRNGATSTAR